jgi:hypothetical protein
VKTSQGLQSYFWSGLYSTWFWNDPANDIVDISFINNVNGAAPNGSPLVRELSAQFVYKAMNVSSPNWAEYLH